MTDCFLATWDGEAFAIAPRHRKICDANFVVGAQYMVCAEHPRDMRAHRAYFAELKSAWMNLPEDQATRFGTPEALRKYALVMTGWRDERTIVAESKAAAQRLASFIRPMDDTAVITARDCVVRVWTPRSQSVKAMGPTDFKASKQAVLEFVAAMIAVSPEALRDNAGKAA